ncbi:hypothetical protein [Nocardia brasiliensis]|uniref:hypothetical protein n=1 Tax=Nocardia brasiliensis TaxID=37326 RepID=UPI002455B6E4|nr:hypothetical protein [Nocardia brasiliensis]
MSWGGSGVTGCSGGGSAYGTPLHAQRFPLSTAADAEWDLSPMRTVSWSYALVCFDKKVSNPLEPEITILDRLSGMYVEDLPVEALPELAAIAGNGAPRDRVRAVSIAGALISAADPYTAEIRDEYGDSIAVLLAEVQSELAAGSPGEEDYEPDAFIDRIHSMLAFEDAAVWSLRLFELIDGEIEVECPLCWAAMTAHLGEPGFFTCTSGYPLDKVTKRPLIPADPDQMTRLGARLHQLAIASRQRTIARQLTYLFGRATCTENGQIFTPADAIERASMP